MSSQLGPIDICCDSPPYAIVQACRHLHFQSPEDVRWLRMSVYRNGQEGGHQDPSLPLWKMLWSSGKPADRTCTCGAPLPELILYLFTFNSGKKAAYLLGQCNRCRTIFWDEP
jgi:hypothetical protein